MRYTNQRGLNISQMTLGTVQLGLNYGISNRTGKPDIQERCAILDEAINDGINSFDTASAYGDSESMLGEYFGKDSLFDDNYIITTKFVFKEKNELSQKEMDRKINEFIEKSLDRLKREKLGIIMLHHYEDLEFYGAKLVNAMKKARSLGIVDKIGVSVHNPYSITDVIGYGAFDAIQAPMNILDARIPKSGILEELKKEEMIVFIRSVFLQGLIFKENDDPIAQEAGMRTSIY